MPAVKEGRTARRALLLCAAALCSSLACEDADRGRAQGISLQNSWPNDDGRFWTYELDAAEYSDSLAVSVYATPEEVPPAPTLDEAIQLLQGPLPGKTARTQHAQYRLRFAGTDTTESGAVGQYLEALLDGQPVASLAGAPAASSAGSAPWRQGGFAAQLRRARPDVWQRLSSERARAAVMDSFEVLPPAPLFLPGGVWEKSAAQIVLYGVLDPDPSWQYLEADLRLGHEFTFQLIKSLASDVFLHARMHRYLSVTTFAATFENALEAVYLVDFGIFEVLGGPGGAPLGYARGFSVGSVVYAPAVGPVWSEERGIYFVGDAEPAGPLASSLSILQATGTSEP